MNKSQRNTGKITTLVVLSAIVIYVAVLIGYPTVAEFAKNAYAAFLVRRYQRTIASTPMPATVQHDGMMYPAASPVLETSTPFATATPVSAAVLSAVATSTPISVTTTPASELPAPRSVWDAERPEDESLVLQWSDDVDTDVEPTPVIYPASSYPKRLVIPAINLDAPIVGVGPKYQQIEGKTVLSWVSPNMYAAGWHLNSVPIGYKGNTVLNGHNNIYGSVFALLHTLELGTEIIIFSDEGEYHYQIAITKLLQEVGATLEQRVENAQWAGRTVDERVTLITCWPPIGNSHRLILVAFPLKAASTATPQPED